MTSPSPEPPAPAADARLVIEVPHWSATVALVDNDLKEVAGLGRLIGQPDGTGRLEAVLPPGAYEVQVTLDGKTQTCWAVLQPGATKTFPASSWGELGIQTAMPLAQQQPTAGADDRLARAAALASVAAPLPAERRCDAPDSRLSIFATAIRPESGEPADFDFDIQLLDEDGEVVADLALEAARPKAVPRRMWRCAFDLDPGYYALRVRDGAGWRLQPVYLCKGMESHLFLRCDGLPQLGSLSLDMGPLGEGYDPEKDRAVAADAVLTALRSPDADRLILGSERLNELLRGEDRNPWLAVLAAYALLPAGPEGEGGDMLGEIRRFLRHGALADHPDVVALLIDEQPPAAPLRYPPMLRVALQRLSAHATDHTETIAPGSPLDKVGNRLIADSAWTAWNEVSPVAAAEQARVGDEAAAQPGPVSAAVAAAAAPQADEASEIGGYVSRLLAWVSSGGLKSVFTSLRPTFGGVDENAASGLVALPKPIRALVQAFPANAPVYPLAEYRDETPAAALAEGATIATHAALIEAAITGLPGGGRVPPAEVQVAMRDDSDGLLDVSAELVSKVSGLALDRVIRNFRQLKQAEPADARAAIVGDLRESLGTLIAAIEAKQSAAGDDASKPATTIEDKVDRLQAESARLRAGAPADQSTAARVGAVADRLSDAADRLLRHAHLVIIADESGTLRYGNRLLRDRLVARGQAGKEAMRRLRDTLAAQTEPRAEIAAKDLSPASPEARAGLSVAVQRTIVRGVDGSLQGYVYYLRGAAVHDLDDAANLRLDAMVSQVTLQVSLAEFGTGENVLRAVERLEALATDIAAILADPPQVGTAPSDSPVSA